MGASERETNATELNENLNQWENKRFEEHLGKDHIYLEASNQTQPRQVATDSLCLRGSAEGYMKEQEKFFMFSPCITILIIIYQKGQVLIKNSLGYGIGRAILSELY